MHDQGLADQLILRGRRAIDANEISQLKSVVQQLISLLPKENTVKPSQSINRLLDKLTLADATALARAGNYMDAELHLMGIMRGEKTHPQVLDLLARIRAQQVRPREAEDYWRQALKHDPMNEACGITSPSCTPTKINAS